MEKEMKNILVTGSCGQIGSELTEILRNKYGKENVVEADLAINEYYIAGATGPAYNADVRNIDLLEEIITKHNIDSVFHMSALLSAVGEKDPLRCWDVNMNGSINILSLGVKHNLNRILIPSSIAVWGPGTPAIAPQETALKPTTMYGVTKVAGEVLADYFVYKYNLDVRGLRYPGIISSETFPGGGTTDYAVAIYYDAVKKGKYTCFVKEDTKLPMMYMPDCLKATIDLAEADFGNLVHHNDFNVGSMSFDVKELADSIKKVMPSFEIAYEPDYRQKIADSWPDGVDDSAARKEWNWSPEYNLDLMTRDMLEKLTAKHQKGLI